MEQRINALREQMKRQISQINSKENLSAFWQDPASRRAAQRM